MLRISTHTTKYEGKNALDIIMDLDCRLTCRDILFYKDIFNSLDTGIILFDESGLMKDANLTALRILPHLKDNLSKYNDFIGFIFDHSIESHHQPQLLNSKTHKAGYEAFHEIIQTDDDEYYVVHMMYRDSDSRKDLIVEMFNVSQIKKREDDILLLDKDKRFLTKAIQSSEKGIFVAENKENKAIIFANQQMNTFFKNGKTGWLNKGVEDFLSNQFSKDWQDIQKVLDQSGQGYFWCVIEKNNDERQWLRLHLFVENSDNDESSIIGFISDETKNKMQENQLLQNQKLEAIGKLAGGIAHDFNNILSIVEGYIRLSETALKRGEPIEDNLNRIKLAVTRGSGLTKQLLTFGKHRVKENEFIDVCAQIKEIEVFLKPLLGADIILKIDVMDTPCFVKSNTDSISQIVMNLVINSRDAMHEGGEILVRVSDIFKDSCTYVVLEVKDTGEGIPHHIISKIFDPFFTTKEQGKGTGLGLSMVYGIVQELKGTIRVSSEIGKGTIFHIEIPMAQDNSLIEFEDRKIVSSSSLQGKTILVAEDEVDLLTIMGMTLKDFGMNVITAKNGDEALLIQDDYDGTIDFLLTDMIMPECGGLKLAELVKEVRPETHILFMSGYPTRGDIANFNLPKDSIFMAKPVKPDILRDYLVQALDGKSSNPLHAKIWGN